MRPALIPCPACHRHVKSGTDGCPFCAAPLAGTHELRPAATPDVRGWKRAAIFTFGAALAVTSCSSTATGTDAAAQDSTPQDTGSLRDTPATDTPSVDMPAADRPIMTPDVASDLPIDFGGVAPPYGITPRDAGPPDDDGTFKADYGAPPPIDAGRDR